jgi:glutamine amidotransferase
MTKVVVVDYGVGNLFSVARGLEKIGATVEISDSPIVIKQAGSLLLPGVGSFEHGMHELKKRGLDDALKEYALNERPFLGICLGMQMMFDYSNEFGEHHGLGLLPGKVNAIPKLGTDGSPHKIPHIGWSPLLLPSSREGWSESILEYILPNANVYFVHSFTAFPDNPAHRLADCNYNGCLISAAVQEGNKFGCQFHPEKSGKVGLNILKRFIEF